MKEEYLKMTDLSSYNTYFKALGIDANSELMKMISEQTKDSKDEWFADQMDVCFTDALKDNINTSNFEKYKYVLIG